MTSPARLVTKGPSPPPVFRCSTTRETSAGSTTRSRSRSTASPGSIDGRGRRWTGEDRAAWTAVAGWLARELRPNGHGVRVWMHDFNWPYRQLLQSPWYSGLAQGNGVSLLVRAAKATGEAAYADAAHAAFRRSCVLSLMVACW